MFESLITLWNAPDKIETVEGKLKHFETIVLPAIQSQIHILEGNLTTQENALKAQSEDHKDNTKARKEFQELWSAQQFEFDLLKKKKAGGLDEESRQLLSGDYQAEPDHAHLKLIVQARGDLQKQLSNVQEKLSSLSSTLDNQSESQKAELKELKQNLILCANLSYAYILMAVYFKAARDHVSAVIDEKEISETILNFGLMILQAAIAAGLSALTGGISGVILSALSRTKLAKDIADFKQSEDADEEDKKTDFASGAKAKLVDDFSDAQSGLIDSAMGFVGDKLTGIGNLLSTESPNNTNQDPFDFFIEKESQLRRILSATMTLETKSELDSMEVGLSAGLTIGIIRKDPFWKVLCDEALSQERFNETWADISILLAVNMKRACWRVFCRSQWNNTKYNYSLQVMKQQDIKDKGYGELLGPAKEWHYKVWQGRVGMRNGLMPRHWDKICSDFRGPEHDARHKFTIRKGLVNRAQLLTDKCAWISEAAVTCCQIKRSGWASVGFADLDEGWHIDLEQYSHHGGGESEYPNQVPKGLTDEDLVFGKIDDPKYKSLTGESMLEKYLRKIRVRGGKDISICEIRFGKTVEHWFKDWNQATGKKGRLIEANEPEQALIVPPRVKVTVNISRVDSMGEDTNSLVWAEFWLFKVEKVQGNEKHTAGGDRCPASFACPYCRDADEGLEDFKKEPYRLKRLEIKREGNFRVRFANFDEHLSEYGLYCIQLDPKKKYQDKTWGDLLFHSEAKWWFRVSSKADNDREPGMPEFVSPETWIVDKVVKGRYKHDKLPTPPTTETVINVWIGDKLYNKKISEVLAEHAFQEWEVVPDDINELSPGKLIRATATWESTSSGRPAQSGEKTYSLLTIPPTINEIAAGSIFIQGYSDAALGSKIVIRVKRNEDFNFLGETVTQELGAWPENDETEKGSCWVSETVTFENEEKKGVVNTTATQNLFVECNAVTAQRGPTIEVPDAQRYILFKNKLNVSLRVNILNGPEGQGISIPAGKKVLLVSNGNGAIFAATSWSLYNPSYPLRQSVHVVEAYVSTESTPKGHPKEIQVSAPKPPKINSIEAGATEITGTCDVFGEARIEVNFPSSPPKSIRAILDNPRGDGVRLWKVNLEANGVNAADLMTGIKVTASLHLSPYQTADQSAKVEELVGADRPPKMDKLYVGGMKIKGTQLPFGVVKVKMDGMATTMTSSNPTPNSWEVALISPLENGQVFSAWLEHANTITKSVERTVDVIPKPAIDKYLRNDKKITGTCVDIGSEGTLKIKCVFKFETGLPVTVESKVPINNLRTKLEEDVPRHWECDIPSTDKPPLEIKATYQREIINGTTITTQSEESEKGEIREEPLPTLDSLVPGDDKISGELYVDGLDVEQAVISILLDGKERSTKARLETAINDGRKVKWQRPMPKDKKSQTHLCYGQRVRARVIYGNDKVKKNWSIMGQVPLPDLQINRMNAGDTVITGTILNAKRSALAKNCFIELTLDSVGKIKIPAEEEWKLEGGSTFSSFLSSNPKFVLNKGQQISAKFIVEHNQSIRKISDTEIEVDVTNLLAAGDEITAAEITIGNRVFSVEEDEAGGKSKISLSANWPGNANAVTTTISGKIIQVAVSAFPSPTVQHITKQEIQVNLAYVPNGDAFLKVEKITNTGKIPLRSQKINGTQLKIETRYLLDDPFQSGDVLEIFVEKNGKESERTKIEVRAFD